MRYIKSRLSFAFFFLIVSLSFVSAEVHPTIPQEVPLPNAVAVLGDSISEAMLVEFSLEHPPTTKQLIKMVKRTEDTEDKTIHNFRVHYAKPQHSWATGDDSTDMVHSHYERIASLKSGVKSYNFAVSGSRIQDLVAQTDSLIAAEDRDKVSMDYVMVLIGANDLKREKIEELTSPLIYEGLLEQVLRRLLERAPQRAILIVGLPDIHEVFELSDDIKVMRIMFKTYKCKDVRESIYGKSVIFDRSNPEGYEASKLIKRMYEASHHNVAARLMQDFPQAHVKAIQDYRNPARVVKTLSTDCFHPSLWGQAIISEVTWSLGFWSDLTAP